MRYKLNKKLMSVPSDAPLAEGDFLVEILTKQAYADKPHKNSQERLLIRELEQAHYCKVDLMQKCNTGTFVVPDKMNLLSKPLVFGYYMDKEHLVFVDDGNTVHKILHQIEKNQILEKTYIPHLLFEFMEYLVQDEVQFLQDYEEQLTDIEDMLMGKGNTAENIPATILKTRKELSRLSSYYNQLLNVGDILSENYNGLLAREDCMLFHLFSDRTARLKEHAKELREYALQIREMYQASLDIKQNQVITFLTIITTIFMPLTLIAGWYGMNFKNMPELNAPYGYIICIIVTAVILLTEIWYFKKKNWLKH